MPGARAVACVRETRHAAATVVWFSSTFKDKSPDERKIDDLAAVNFCVVTTVCLFLLEFDLKHRPRRIKNFFIWSARRQPKPGTVLLLVRRPEGNNHKEILIGATGKGHRAIPGPNDLVIRLAL